jgi:hypothetical protein
VASKRSASAVGGDDRPDDSQKAYEQRAQQAAERMTPEYIKRGKRIQKLGATGTMLFEEAMRLSDRIADMCGPEAAIDIFKNVAQIRHARMLTRRPGKRSGSHNPDMDKVLLDHFSDDPNSFLSLAKRGLLPGETRHFTKQEFAQRLVDAPGGRERWGATSGQQILRRLTYLKKKTKSLRD